MVFLQDNEGGLIGSHRKKTDCYNTQAEKVYISNKHAL